MISISISYYSQVHDSSECAAREGEGSFVVEK